MADSQPKPARNKKTRKQPETYALPRSVSRWSRLGVFKGLVRRSMTAIGPEPESRDAVVRALHWGPMYSGLATPTLVFEIRQADALERREKMLEELTEAVEMDEDVQLQRWQMTVGEARRSIESEVVRVPQYWLHDQTRPFDPSTWSLMDGMDRARIVQYLLVLWGETTPWSRPQSLSKHDVDSLRAVAVGDDGVVSVKPFATLVEQLYDMQAALTTSVKDAWRLQDLASGLADVLTLLNPPVEPGQTPAGFSGPAVWDLLPRILHRAKSKDMHHIRQLIASELPLHPDMPVRVSTFVSSVYDFVRRQITQERQNRTTTILKIIDDGSCAAEDTDALIDAFLQSLGLGLPPLAAVTMDTLQRALASHKSLAFMGRYAVKGHADMESFDVSDRVIKALGLDKDTPAISPRRFVSLLITPAKLLSSPQTQTQTQSQPSPSPPPPPTAQAQPTPPTSRKHVRLIEPEDKDPRVKTRIVVRRRRRRRTSLAEDPPFAPPLKRAHFLTLSVNNAPAVAPASNPKAGQPSPARSLGSELQQAGMGMAWFDLAPFEL